MTNPRGLGPKSRSRARMGRSSRSTVAGADDPRWDRDARQQATDFTQGLGLRPDRNGRDAVAISGDRGNLLRATERGELYVSVPESEPSKSPAPVQVGLVSDPESAAAIGVLVAAVNRLQEILREQGATI